MADEKRPPQVVAAYNEMEYGIRTGDDNAVVRGRKRLDAAGMDGAAAEADARSRYKAETADARRAEAAERRAEAAKAKAAADAEAKAKEAAEAEQAALAAAEAEKAALAAAESTPPQGRTTAAKATTAKNSPTAKTSKE